MAEAEDVITDVARHATVFAQQLWRRHRKASRVPEPLHLADVAQRLDLLIAAIFGRSFPLRSAQAEAPPTWLSGVFRRRQTPPPREALPATDGHAIWLPATMGPPGAAAAAIERLRTMALQQAMRAHRGSATALPLQAPHQPALLLRELYLLLEARAADDELARLMPGLALPLARHRHRALMHRPKLDEFPAASRPIECLARAILESKLESDLPPDVLAGLNPADFALPASATSTLHQARSLCHAMASPAVSSTGRLLWRDAWTGDLRATPAAAGHEGAHLDEAQVGEVSPSRSARLARRPEVREEIAQEDDQQPGAWMVQPSPPHEQAEDPMGMQRPTDRDTQVAAEEFADALSELPEARLVSVPGKPKEVLLSDDPPPALTRRNTAGEAGAAGEAPDRVQYPEWDWRTGTYRVPGATVLLLPAAAGPQQWIDETLAQRAGMLHVIRRRFEMLRAQPVRVRKQLEGDELDLDAWIEARADFKAGRPMSQGLYLSHRRSRRDMAIMLLVDVSGSTDGWIAPQRRVIDVEREALLLVCLALQGMAEPYNVLAFSGEGPQAVVVRSVKRFDEPYGAAVAQRIAGLEPEHYTRAGAAIRHAGTLLMREPAQHRLLLLLSDGKPNDVDDYEGRYGLEDMRQAVTEASLQGIAPFCLTVDRQAASYLPAVFGPHRYALLPKPELLPTVLLEWLRRLMTH